MGSLTLDCPLCCGETFHNPQSLKYHLLSMTDNLYCPGCSERLDSVLALIRHLDSCGQSSDLEKKEAKSKPKMGKRDSSKPVEVLVVKKFMFFFLVVVSCLVLLMVFLFGF